MNITRICVKCGKEFEGYKNAKYCNGCHPIKNRNPRKLVTVGNTYGYITVLNKLGGRPPEYTCRCEKCGEEFKTTGQMIFLDADVGCNICRKEQTAHTRENKYKSYIGNTYGNLKVVGYAGLKQVSKNSKYSKPFMLCKCLKCENESEIPLTRLKLGAAEICAKCARKSLELGKDAQGVIGGTKIVAIDGRRKLNKNSTTLHTGVSYMKKRGKYRAYICFCGKQYHLGYYMDIERAIAARKEAERHIYGSFLEWYAETYPEEWEKIKRKEVKNEK